jgi:hypothetical protein
MISIVTRWKRSAATLAAGALALGVGGVARAAILGPYATADADTLHLYHFNEAAGSTTVVDSKAGGQNMQGVLNGATLGNTSFPGFGTSLDTSSDALLPANAAGANPPHRPIVLAAPTLSNADADAVSLDWAGADGAFTLEAIVKLDASFNVAATDYRNGVVANTGGNYPMEIISGEGEGNGARLLQFRINQIGAGSAANVAGGAGTASPRLEFASLRGIVSNQALSINLPTAGAHAINNTDWFHVAVAYNGVENTANNTSLYWTKLTTGFATANLLGQGQLNMDPVEGLTAFAIGNEARDAGGGAGEGESFVGKIDEVRISSVARSANQFIFGVPEPATTALALGGLAALSAVRRRSA